MRFYEGHTLQSTTSKISFFTKKKLVFPDKILKKIPSLTKEDISVNTKYYKDDTSAHICLKAGNYTLACCTLSTVEYNCSALMVANLYSDTYFHKGLGWFLLDLIEQWAIYAGYTLLIGNTAAPEQNQLIPKFRKQGWVESDINYVNLRTRYRNIWLYKVIANAEEQDEDEDEYYEEDTEPVFD